MLDFLDNVATVLHNHAAIHKPCKVMMQMRMVRNKMLSAIMFMHSPLNLAIAEIIHSDVNHLMVSSWFKVKSIAAEESRRQELEAAGHTAPTGGSQRGVSADQCSVFLLHSVPAGNPMPTIKIN